MLYYVDLGGKPSRFYVQFDFKPNWESIYYLILLSFITISIYLIRKNDFVSEISKVN